MNQDELDTFTTELQDLLWAYLQLVMRMSEVLINVSETWEPLPDDT